MEPRKEGKKWVVSVPRRWTESNTRERSYFQFKKEAQAFADGVLEKVEQHGEQASAIKPSLAETATRAEDLLRPYGISLMDAVLRIVAEEKERAESATIDTATRAFEATKEEVSEKHFANIQRDMAALRDDFAWDRMADIKTEAIKRHLDGRSNGTVEWNNIRRRLNTFWRWSAKQGWAKPDTVENVARRHERKTDIRALKPKEAEALMRAAEENFPECVPALVLCLFSGVRVDEVCKLEVGAIRREDIVVSTAVSKTGSARVIKKTPQVRAWLKVYPPAKEGTVIPSNWDRKYKAVRRLAGWRVWTDLVEPNKPPADLPEWPQNAMRHTAPSVHLRLGKPTNVLIFEHGHTGNERTLKKHYLAPLETHEAKAIDKLRPKKAKR